MEAIGPIGVGLAGSAMASRFAADGAGREPAGSRHHMVNGTTTGQPDEMAAMGTRTVMAGGRRQAFDARRAFYRGPCGSGARMKLVGRSPGSGDSTGIAQIRAEKCWTAITAWKRGWHST